MKKGRSLWNQLLEVMHLHLFLCWLLSFVFERRQSQTGKRQYERMTEFSSSSSTLERTVEGCTNRFSLKLFEISFQINFPPKICSTSQIARFFDRQYLSDERWTGLIFFADRHTKKQKKPRLDFSWVLSRMSRSLNFSIHCHSKWITP